MRLVINDFVFTIIKIAKLITLDAKYDYKAAVAFITKKAFTQGFEI